MIKPKKLKMTEGITHNRFISGYNEAWDEMEAYYKQRIKENYIRKDKLLSMLRR